MRKSGAAGLTDRSRVSRSERASSPGQVGLGHQQAVGDRGLFDGLLMAGQALGTAQAVDRGDHPVQAVTLDEQGIGHQGLQDWRRIGEPRGLDHQGPKGRHLASYPLLIEPAQGLDQITANAAAEAAAVQQHRLLVDSFHQQVIQADLAELVDDHRGLRHGRVGQQMSQQGWSCRCRGNRSAPKPAGARPGS